MTDFTILIVDDEPAQRQALEGFLRKKGYKTLQAESAEPALEKVRDTAIDLVLTDLRMPGKDGLQLVVELKLLNPQIDVIVMTAYGTLDGAIQVMKEGAVDFITKPIDLAQLELTIAKLTERRQLVSENKRLRELVGERLNFGGIIAISESMQTALSVAVRAAASRATVLILGESGTGKELVAKAIHMASPRAQNPFIPVNMAALPEHLVESELFGHEKGAFTGADKPRQGRFESAHTGTLFIDEVGDMPLSTQSKLLRVLQEQRFERLGSSHSIAVDVRVLAATHRPIEQLVKEGQFREDLFYRLNVVRVELPPLQSRKEDIPLMAEQFLQRFAQENGKTVRGFTKEALDQLIKYSYPGNVRELQHIIEQAVVLCRGEWIDSRDLHLSREETAGNAAGAGFQEKVQAFEIGLIRDALQQSHGVQSHAAALLGMSERHLRYKLQKYGLKE